MQNIDTQSLVITLLIGLIAGWLASIIMGGGGLIRYLITGLIGAFVGSLLVYWLKLNINVGGPIVSQIIVSTLGAIVVIFIARRIA